MNAILPDLVKTEAARRWDRIVEALGRDAAARLPAEVRGSIVPALSDFVTGSCLRHPDLLPDLCRSGDLMRPAAAAQLDDRVAAAVRTATTETELMTALRNRRRREMVRIAWRDLAGWADLAETCGDASRLAAAVLDHTLARLHAWLETAWGRPGGSDAPPERLVVVGMGKLGADELNFSSDIDLVFAFARSGTTTGGGRRQVTHSAFFTRLCQRLLHVIGTATADGFVFRVDTRLRPDGEAGPLVASFDNLESYYQHRGRDWERYAWIKAAVVAGDRDAGRRLIERLRPFVYRRYLDFGAVEALRAMKARISAEISRRDTRDNIKLGWGGIREVEFFAQIFQLIRGGVDPLLQERRLLTTLDQLAANGYVPAKAAGELAAAYRFLRRVENRLQMAADRQVHDLPREPEARLRLAAAMGYADWETFRTALADHRRRVHHHFELLLAPSQGPATAFQGRPDAPLALVWQERRDDARTRERLAAAGYPDPAAVVRLLEHWRQSPAVRLLSREGRRLMDRLAPRILERVGRSRDPLPTLEHLVELIQAVSRRTCYLSLLLENPAALDHLILLVDASAWLASLVSRHPVLLDELLDPRTLYHPPTRKQLEQRLARRLQGIAAGNLDFQMELLRIFQQSGTLRVAAADITRTLALMRVSDHLSHLAEVVVASLVDLAWDHLARRHGAPECHLDGRPLERGFAVLAYGKLGGLEMSYGSDLDLVFLHAGRSGNTRGGDRPVAASVFFARLGQRVIHLLTAPTPAGVLYKVDMRLRPSGNAGLLVSHYAGFAAYQARQARTWEHQALLRARAICGDAPLRRWFEAARRHILTRPRPALPLRADIVAMRRQLRAAHDRSDRRRFDLKYGRGGIMDIEFLVQYLVLRHAAEHPALVEWTDTVRLLGALAQAGCLTEAQACLLRLAYLSYRSVGHRLNLQHQAGVVPQERLRRLRRETVRVRLSVMG